MATIRRRKSRWQLQIRRRGHQLSRTFHLRADAELWARQQEAELDRGGLPTDSRRLRAHTLTDLLRRYEAEIVPRKRSADREVYLLRVILRHPVAQVSLHLLTTAEIAKYRDHRLSLVKGDTVRRELAIVRHCIEVARKEWGFVLPSNPVQQVKLPRAGNSRQRRAQPGELEKLLKACEVSRCHWLPAVIQMAVEIGMRRGELLAMRWDDVDLEARTALLRNTKNGFPRTVPLSPRALKVLQDLPRCGPTVFTVSANALRLAWERLRRRAGVLELRFHDLRHEAVSRFFERGLNGCDDQRPSRCADAVPLHAPQGRGGRREAEHWKLGQGANRASVHRHVVFWIRTTEKLCRNFDFVSMTAPCHLCVQS